MNHSKWIIHQKACKNALMKISEIDSFFYVFNCQRISSVLMVCRLVKKLRYYSVDVYSIVLTIWKPDHSKYDLQNVRISKDSRFWMVGFWISTVHSDPQQPSVSKCHCTFILSFRLKPFAIQDNLAQIMFEVE